MRTKAFTLVELLIVITILALLAGIVIPQFSNAATSARASMLADDLRVIRTQIMVFKGQHQGVSPGYPDCDITEAPTEAAFVAYMSGASAMTGELGEAAGGGKTYGPYLSQMITNPMNGKATIQVIADGASFPGAGDDSHGWIYQPSTLLFRADSPGSDEHGRPYFDY